MTTMDLAMSRLGRKTAYIDKYDSTQLFPVTRQLQRDEIGVRSPLPFLGCDRWYAYELSWLNSKGKPEIALGEFVFPCESLNLIESKSLKLYLNSLNNTIFESRDVVQQTIADDLTHSVGAPVEVNLFSPTEPAATTINAPDGICLDDLDIACDTYEWAPHFLTRTQGTPVEEVVYSHLLRSNCLVTGQPDWGSVQIHYRGDEINREGLLRYIISFRNHHEFAEHCTERMFIDILTHCQPTYLSVSLSFTRRGGLAIAPIRCTHLIDKPKYQRLFRQ